MGKFLLAPFILAKILVESLILAVAFFVTVVLAMLIRPMAIPVLLDYMVFAFSKMVEVNLLLSSLKFDEAGKVVDEFDEHLK